MNGRPIRNSLPHLVIQSDASNSGWGAVSNGVCSRGTWTQEEASLHINCKELLAASFAVKAFTKNLQNVHVLIQTDNIKPDFFRLSFRNFISCVNNCEDLLYIYFFIPQFKYMNFIYSQFQYHNHCLYKQNGGSRKVSPRSLCTTSVELVSRKENHSKGRTHPRLSQHNSRQGIASHTRHIRLASEPELLSDINGQARPVYDRPFCKQNQSPTFQVFQLQTRPGSRGDRCPDTTMGNSNSREGNNNSSMPSSAHSAMVCTTPPTGGGHPHPPSHNNRAFNRPSGSRAPSGEQKILLLSGWRVSDEIFLQKAYQDKLRALSSLPRELQPRISTSHAGQNGWAGVINNKLIPFTLVS